MSYRMTSEEVDELCSATGFQAKEIHRLYSRFKKLDRSRSGVISRKDFQLISELRLNPMARRIMALFRNDDSQEALDSGGLTFDVFVKTLSVFRKEAPLDIRSQILFRAYDIDADGIISDKDLEALLRVYTGPHLTAATVRVIARQTLKSACFKLNLDSSQIGSSESTTNKPFGLTLEHFKALTGQECGLLTINPIDIED